MSVMAALENLVYKCTLAGLKLFAGGYLNEMWLAGNNGIGCQHGKITCLQAFVIQFAENLVKIVRAGLTQPIK